MRVTSTFISVLLVAWVLLAIIDMWFDIISWPVFIKLTITLALLGVVVLVIALLKRESLNDKDPSKDV